MPGNILTTTSTIMCPHGGRAMLITANSRVFANNAPALLEVDVHTVMGCLFYRGDTYSPCVRIEWSSGASKATINGTPILIKSSIGKCINADGVTQGVASIVNTQIKVSAQ